MNFRVLAISRINSTLKAADDYLDPPIPEPIEFS